jgi:glycerophosphoryl diester phosphodiesterase
VELNIEIKGRSTELARRVARLVDTFGVADRVVVSSFEVEPLEWLADHAPEIPRACLWGGVWPRWPDFATFSPLVFMRRARASIAHPMASLVTPELMDQARARDWKVYAWMPMVGEEHDREEKWTRLVSAGVDGLCTNYPRQLAAWLRENAAHTRLARRLAEVPATFSRISQ